GHPAENSVDLPGADDVARRARVSVLLSPSEGQRVDTVDLQIVRAVEPGGRAVAGPHCGDVPGGPGVIVVREGGPLRPGVSESEHASSRKLTAKLILPAVVVRRVERRIHRDIGGAAPFLSQHAAIRAATRKAVIDVGPRRLANGSRRDE